MKVVKPSSSDWTEREISLSVQAYLLMLRIQQAGTKPNKGAVRLTYLSQLHDLRTPGSWDRRMCNISAVFLDLGLPYVKGYKPLKNVGNNVRSLIIKSALRHLI